MTAQEALARLRGIAEFALAGMTRENKTAMLARIEELYNVIETEIKRLEGIEAQHNMDNYHQEDD